MAIVYPITPPSTIASSIRFEMVSVIAQSTSPFTLEQEIFEHVGQMWTASIQLPSMDREEGEAWVGFLGRLNGILGTFLLGDPIGQVPMGAATGTPVVNGSGQQRSKTLNTTGWTPNTLVLKAGDYIQLPNYRLHKVLSDATSDGSGNASLDIFPRVRDNLSSGATIITNNTVGIFRLQDNISSYDITTAQQYGINISFREAI